MTIWQYITRKDGFGRTSWLMFALIASAIVFMGITAFTADEVAVRWVCGIFAVLVAAIMIGGTLNNYNRDK
jgi:uncharacterized membrane protein